jgi:[NiFe] hydrogenase diaphorase moiety large subunit
MTEDLATIVQNHGCDPKRLVEILHDVTDAHGYVSKGAITELASRLGLPRGHVEGVVGFYAFFSDEPRGEYRVLFSDGTTDRMAGSLALLERMRASFGLRGDEPSRDGRLSVGTTSCTGLCDQGPALLVNGHAIGGLDVARLGDVMALVRARAPLATWPRELFDVRSTIARRDLLLTASVTPGEATQAAARRGRDATLAEISRSGLRGRGGAGFPTGAKWAACANAHGEPRYVVCNADEGEPGTFKDRELLAHHLDLVLEGMTVAAFAVGASRGFLYVRAEYRFLFAHIEEALATRRAACLLGANACGIHGFSFDVELRRGAGAYVCGEESALLESLEGKRGIPRNRPPFPVTHGYDQKPTIVNNVETFMAAALVARDGASALRDLGTRTSSGTKVLSVAGDVARPGVYEYPFGVTLQKVLDDAGAARTQAVQVSGPAGMLLSARELDRTIAFEDVPSAGAFTVFDDTRDILGIIENHLRFFAHESCGFCTPCRVGTTLVARTMGRITAGHGARRDLVDLERVARVMAKTSHCGLGVMAGNPVLQGLERFRPAFDARLRPVDALPTFDLDASLDKARDVTGRDDDDAHLAEESPP